MSHEILRSYLCRGWCPTPLAPKSKRPIHSEWARRVLTESDIPKCWTNGQGVGLVLGLSGLTDVDLDCDVALSLADRFLPATSMIGGHDGRPKSHWFYRCRGVASERFAAPGEGRPLVELRAGDAQTVVAPSTHPEGHTYRWFDLRGNPLEEPGRPAEATADGLRRAIARLAAATLLARRWPSGLRHDIALALAGALRRARWTLHEAVTFIESVAVAAGDAEAADRVRAVQDTYDRPVGDPVTGLTRLAQLVGREVTDRVAEWLDLRPEPPTVAFTVPEDQWPAPLAPEAYHGVAGDLVRALEPATEADSAGLLVQFLVATGNLLNRTVYAQVEGDRHGVNEYAVLVGRTSKGRKGTSWGRIRSLLAELDSEWAGDRVMTGLASGEGLLWAVRDPVQRMERVSQGRGEPPRYEEVIADAGVTDKRLLVVEPEFASVLACCERQATTLSATIRCGWDSGTFRQLVKNNPVRATDAHVSIIGHITEEELKRLLTSTEAANGFANRFLWVCTRRSKLLPDGGVPDEGLLLRVRERLQRAVAFARSLDGPVRRDERAAGLWREVYPHLTADRPGLWGAITARAEAHVLRLSLIYAVLDCSAVVRAEHLTAALAVWQYCEDSARCIWGDSTGDDLADEILRLLRAAPEGLTRRELHDLTGRNHTATRLARALGVLVKYGMATRREDRDTGGRPAERWKAVTRGGGRELP